MKWGWGRRSDRAPVFGGSLSIAVVTCGLALAGCNTVAQQSPSLSAPRGSAVAFDSIDGPPRDLFDRLVQDLNTEAQDRRLTVASRDSTAAYRVRGYLGAQSSRKQSAITWVWDVYDQDQQRVLRISGEETIKGKHRDAWQALDEAAVRRIAHNSIEQLAAFLGAADAPAATTAAYASANSASPEAAGIYRMPSAQADPVPTRNEGAPDPGQTPIRRAASTVIPPSEAPSGTN